MQKIKIGWVCMTNLRDTPTPLPYTNYLPIYPSVLPSTFLPFVHLFYLFIHQSMHNTQLSTAITSTTITTAAICTTIAILYHVLLYSKHCSQHFHRLSYLSTTLQSKYYYSYFLDKEAEVQKNKLTVS